MPVSNGIGRAHEHRNGSRAARGQAGGDRGGRPRAAKAGRAVQSHRGLCRPARRSTTGCAGRAVPGRAWRGSTAGRRGELTAAGALPGGSRARVCRGLLCGAASRRHGGAVSAAAVARETGARLAKAVALNATLHWSQACLDAEAGRVDAMPAKGALDAMPIAVKDNIVTVEEPTTCG